MTCYICDHNGTGPRPATAICNELHQPVCRCHAEWCLKEGHGHRPLHPIPSRELKPHADPS